MGKQYNKVEKRGRRAAYMKRKKIAGRAKAGAAAPKKSVSEAAEAKDAAST